MSIFTCKLCDQQKDCDFDSCYEYEDGLICEDCNENSGLPEIKPIPKITTKVREMEELVIIQDEENPICPGCLNRKRKCDCKE